MKIRQTFYSKFYFFDFILLIFVTFIKTDNLNITFGTNGILVLTKHEERKNHDRVMHRHTDSYTYAHIIITHIANVVSLFRSSK